MLDGHSGWQTSRLLSSTLVSYIARELDAVFRSAQPYADLYTSLTSSTTPATPSKTSALRSLFSVAPTPPLPTQLDLVDDIMQTAMKNAFVKLDNEIVGNPIKLLEEAEQQGTLSKPSKDSNMSPSQTEAVRCSSFPL